MDSFHLATIQLAAPITLRLGRSGRPRILAAGPAPAATPHDGPETVFEKLDIAFWANLVTQTIHAQIARIPPPLLIYGPEDFAAVATDLPAQHAERVLQCLGTDPAATLQALIDGTELPPRPPRIPREIPNWRAKAILSQMGLLAPIEAALASLPEPERTVASLAWHGDAKLARHGKTVLGLSAALGLSDAQIDALFIAADALEV